MSGINLVPFTPAHGMQLLKQGVAVIEWNDVKHSQLVAIGVGEAYTLMRGNCPLACGGIARVWPGYGEVWLILSKEGAKYPIAVFRACRDMFNAIWNSGIYHRLQATVLESVPQGCRLIERLGFTLEHTMPNAGPNHESLRLYSKVR